MLLKYLMVLVKLNVISCKNILYDVYPTEKSKSFIGKISNADNEKTQNLFPDVIYPTSILDVVQPFFYGANMYDEVLGPFSEEVKLLYKNITANTKKSNSKINEETQGNALYDNNIIVVKPDIRYSEDNTTTLTGNKNLDKTALEKVMESSETSNISSENVTNIKQINNDTTNSYVSDSNETSSIEVVNYDSKTEQELSLPFETGMNNKTLLINYEDSIKKDERYRICDRKNDTIIDELRSSFPIQIRINMEVYKIFPKEIKTELSNNTYHEIIPEAITDEIVYVENYISLEPIVSLEKENKTEENAITLVFENPAIEATSVQREEDSYYILDNKIDFPETQFSLTSEGNDSNETLTLSSLESSEEENISNLTLLINSPLSEFVNDSNHLMQILRPNNTHNLSDIYPATDIFTKSGNNEEEQNEEDNFLDFIISLDSLMNDTTTYYIRNDKDQDRLLNSDEYLHEGKFDNDNASTSYYYYY